MQSAVIHYVSSTEVCFTAFSFITDGEISRKLCFGDLRDLLVFKDKNMSATDGLMGYISKGMLKKMNSSWNKRKKMRTRRRQND